VKKVLLLFFFLIAGCQNPRTSLQKGNAAYLNGDLGNAVLQYEQARGHRTTRGVAEYNLGRLYLEQGQAERALSYLGESSSAPAQGPLLHVFRARAFRATGAREEARGSLREASTDDPEVTMEWALLESEEGNLPRALELLEQVKKSPVHWEKATLESANIRARMGDTKGAASELEWLLKMRPQRADIRNLLQSMGEQSS
jgi:tetratricopeptide (TPR) repeat protein